MADRLIVLNKDEDTVSVVDPDSGETVTTVETDFNPHEVVVTPDGSKAYVTCSLGNAVNVLDTDSWAVTARIEHEAFEFPHGLAVSDDELYLAATYGETLFAIDWRADEIVDHWETPQDLSHMVALAPDGQTGYVSNIGSDSVSVVDFPGREIVATIPVGEGPEGVAVHPDGDLLFVANQDDDELSILELDTYDEVHDRPLPLGTTPIRVVFSPDGRYAFVPNRESDDLSVVDTEHERNGETVPWEVKRLPVGTWPGGTVFDAAGERAFVANNKTNDVSVVDVGSLEEVDRYGVGIHPDGIAYLAD